MSKKNKKSSRIEELLLRDAEIRLKRFIEDLRHDPMFKHRIFYPVLYKQVEHTLRTEKAKDKNDTLRVQEVIYEYYLFKAENFCANGETFLAILLANGPMLPEQHRLFLDDSGHGLFNRNNRDLALRRTLTFIEMLNNQTLFDFVFSSVLGHNSFDTMRERFYQICENRNRGPADFNRYQRINATDNLNQNMNNVLDTFRRFFRNVNERHIRALLNFMVYMGDVRNIVTRFSYRPMSQDQLEALYGEDEGYYLNEEQQRTLEHFNMLEEALNQKILDKITAEHIEFYTEEAYNHYSAICAEINNRDPAEIRSLREAIKRKLARTLTDIHTYTRNYISRSILRCSGNPEICNDDREATYINRIIHAIARENDPERALNALVDGPMGYQYFIENPDDLAAFLRRIFENDVRYINEICCNKHQEHLFTGNPSRVRTLRDRYTGDMIYDTQRRSNITGQWVIGRSETDVIEDARRRLIENIESIINPVSSFDIFSCLNRDIEALLESIYAINYIYSKIMDEKYEFGHDDIIEIEREASSYRYLEELVQDLNPAVRQIFYNFAVEFEAESDLLHEIDDIADEELEYLRNILNGDIGILGRLFTSDPLQRAVHSIKNKQFRICYQVIILTRALEKLRDEIESSDDYTHELFSAIFNAIKTRLQELLNEKTRESTLDIDRIVNIIENAIPRKQKNRNRLIGIVRGYLGTIRQVYTDNVNCVCQISRLIKRVVTGNMNAEKRPACFSEAEIQANTEALLKHYFTRYLKPVLVDFVGYALNNITFQNMRDRLEVDIVSKDSLHLSSLLDNRSADLITIDGAVYNDLANYTQILMADTYASLDLRNEADVTRFLHEVYHINYANLIVLGRQYAYLHLNTIGNPYLYRGAQNKIPIKHLEDNYEFLMGPKGLYNNLPNIKPPKK